MAASGRVPTQLTKIRVFPSKLPGGDSIDELESFIMPELMRNFPWNKGLNKYYSEAKAESDAWLESLRPFSSKGHSIYNGWDFAYLAASCFTEGSYATFRNCCDLMNVFFVVDEQTDNQPIEIVQERSEIAFDAVQHPHKARPEGECILGEITRQYWEHASSEMPKVIIERFERTWHKYLDSVVRQAENRDRQHILTPKEYLLERVNNIGTWPCYAAGEQCSQLNIPHDIMEHPTLETMRTDVAFLVALQNDLFSYRKEKLTDDMDYNAITVVMYHEGKDLAGAVQWISDKHEEILAEFMQLRNDVIEKDGFPSWGSDLDDQIVKYTDLLADTIRGNYEWSWHTQRYFPGDMGKIARVTGRIIIG